MGKVRTVRWRMYFTTTEVGTGQVLECFLPSVRTCVGCDNLFSEKPDVFGLLCSNCK